MRFFFRSKDERKAEEGSPSLQINLSGRPYNAYSKRDVAMKLWLPESIKDKLNEVCTYIDTSISDFLRQVLFVHIYGRVDFLGLLQSKHSTALNSHIDTGIVPDVTPQVELRPNAVKKPKVSKSIREHSTASVKIWVPSKMKDDLELLAVKNKISLSNYSRRVIITHLLGNMPYDSTPFKASPPFAIIED